MQMNQISIQIPIAECREMVDSVYEFADKQYGKLPGQKTKEEIMELLQSLAKNEIVTFLFPANYSLIDQATNKKSSPEASEYSHVLKNTAIASFVVSQTLEVDKKFLNYLIEQQDAPKNIIDPVVATAKTKYVHSLREH
jgi:hypothetical protein